MRVSKREREKMAYRADAVNHIGHALTFLDSAPSQSVKHLSLAMINIRRSLGLSAVPAAAADAPGSPASDARSGRA